MLPRRAEPAAGAQAQVEVVARGLAGAGGVAEGAVERERQRGAEPGQGRAADVDAQIEAGPAHHRRARPQRPGQHRRGVRLRRLAAPAAAARRQRRRRPPGAGGSCDGRRSRDDDGRPPRGAREAAPGAEGEASIGLVRRTPPAALLSALVALLLVPAAAPAARGVLVMDAHGRVRTHRDAAPATTAEARPSAAAARALRAQPATRARAQTTRGSVLAVLGALGARGDVTPQERTTWAAGWRSAGATLKKLRGARRVQLGAVVANLTAAGQGGAAHAVARAAGVPDARAQPRLVVEGPPAELRPARRLRGQRARLAVLPGPGHPGAVAGHLRQGQRAPTPPRTTTALSRLLGEALELAAQRAGGLAFEYTFQFDGGRPPWVSGLAQGTGIQALSRAASRLGDPAYADAARSALGVFRTPPPEGVRVGHAGRGPLPAVLLRAEAAHRQRLRAVAQRPARPRGLGAGRRRAGAVHRRRGRAARGAARASTRARGRATRCPAASPSLSYHVLLRDFLRSLCGRLTTDAKKARGLPAAAPYCAAEERFTADLATPARPARRRPAGAGEAGDARCASAWTRPRASR